MTQFKTLSTIVTWWCATAGITPVHAQQNQAQARNRADSLYMAGEFTTAAKAYRDLAAVQADAASRAQLLTIAAASDLEGGEVRSARAEFARAYAVDSSANGPEPTRTR